MVGLEYEVRCWFFNKHLAHLAMLEVSVSLLLHDLLAYLELDLKLGQLLLFLWLGSSLSSDVISRFPAFVSNCVGLGGFPVFATYSVFGG